MRFLQKTYLVSLIVLAGSLVLSGLAEFYNTKAGWGGWRLVRPACCITGAMGVIWLSWRWLRLVGEITSIAEHLCRDGLPITKPGCSRTARELSEAISTCTCTKSNRESLLEKQVRDLQVKLQLSQRQKRNTEAIIYGIRDAVVVVDEFDRLVMANEAAERLFKFDFRASQHRPLLEVVGPEKSDFATALHQIRLSGVRHTKREMKFAVDSRFHIFDCIVSCVYEGGQLVEAKRFAVAWQDTVETAKPISHSEGIYGVVAVLHDVTREKEVSQMKDDFVSHVSHELKTPLASITAYSEMLLDDEIDDEKTRKEFYSVIQNQAKRLNRLIEDILNTVHRVRADKSYERAGKFNDTDRRTDADDEELCC